MKSEFDTFIKNLSHIAPNSRSEMLHTIKTLLSKSLLQVIDTHNTSSAVFIFLADSKKYVLKAEYGIANATSKEIIWYKNLINQSLAPKYLNSTGSGNCAFLFLEYVENAQTLDEVALGQIEEEKCWNYLDSVIKKEKELFEASGPRTIPLAQMDKLYIDKFYARAAEAKQFTYLYDLLSLPYLTINGSRVFSPVHYLQRVKNSALFNYLTPKNVGMTHGDLHCGNILIATNDDAYLVDPNGNLHMPLEYDYGKLLHSIHGGYGQIMKQMYVLEENKNRDYHFRVQIPAVYQASFNSFTRKITDHELHKSMYAEALHFATMLPHHAANRQETTALFLRCVQVFDELFDMLGKRKNA